MPNFVDAFLEALPQGVNAAQRQLQLMLQEERIKDIKKREKQEDDAARAIFLSQSFQQLAQSQKMLQEIFQRVQRNPGIAAETLRLPTTQRAVASAQAEQVKQREAARAEKELRKVYQKLPTFRGNDEKIEQAIGIQTAGFPNEQARQNAMRDAFPELAEDELTQIRIANAKLALAQAQDQAEARRIATNLTGIPNGTIATSQLNDWLANPEDPEAIKQQWLRYRALQKRLQPQANEMQLLEAFAKLHPASEETIAAVTEQVKVPDAVVTIIDQGIQTAKASGVSQEAARRQAIGAIDQLVKEGRIAPPLALTDREQKIVDQRFRKQLREAVRIMFNTAWEELEQPDLAAQLLRERGE